MLHSSDSLLLLGQGLATFHNAAPSHDHDHDSVPWEGLDQSPRMAPIPKRNLNDLPFISINFRNGRPSCFSRPTHILLFEGDTLGRTSSILRIHPFL